VLCLHKVSRRFLWEGTWTTPARLGAAVDHLRERGYSFITESEYLDALDRREQTRNGPDRRLFVTFDDGYEDVYREAFPILGERGIPFHVFVVTDFVGQANTWDLSLGRRPSRHASWDEIGEMASAGVTFGAHTASHRDLTRLSATDAACEMTQSRDALAAHLGKAPRTVSYPFGRYNHAAKEAARDSGFDAAFSLYPPHGNEYIDRYALRRNGVYIIDPAWILPTKLGHGAMFWFEEMKCRTINAVAALTPLLKGSRRS